MKISKVLDNVRIFENTNHRNIDKTVCCPQWLNVNVIVKNKKNNSMMVNINNMCSLCRSSAITQAYIVLVQHKTLTFLIFVATRTVSGSPATRRRSMLLSTLIFCVNVFNPPSVYGFHSLVGNILCRPTRFAL